MLTIKRVFVNCVEVSESGSFDISGGLFMISWQLASDNSASCQAAYKIELTGDSCDSKWVNSPEQFCEINAPVSKNSARLALYVKDNLGNESKGYTINLFTVDAFDRAEWLTDLSAKREGAKRFVKSVKIDEKPVAAEIFAAALGYVSISVNDKTLSGSRLNPAFTDYSKRVQYAKYTLDDLSAVCLGENLISVSLAAGWRDNYIIHNADWLGQRKFPFEGETSFIFAMRLSFSGKPDMWVYSDSTWLSVDSPITRANIFDGETYDSRIGQMSNPRRATCVPKPDAEIEPMIIPLVTELAPIKPIAYWRDGDGVIFDFGKNIAGVVSVAIPHGTVSGTEVTICHSEELTEDGRLFTDTLRGARAYDVYISNGTDGGAYTPTFTYHGFRYARVGGLGACLTACDVTAIPLCTDVKSRSNFVCGSALATKIHDICVNTELSNIHSIFTDCPQRDERLGWLNDATVRFEATPYNFRVGAMYPKIIRDILDVQTDEGAIGCTAPFIAGAIPADPVCSSFLVAGYEAYMHTGNLNIIAKAYDGYARWEEFLLSRSDNYIVNYSYYGDWASPLYACDRKSVDDPGAVSDVTPGIFMSTGYSYYNCVLLQKFAKWLGKSEDAIKYSKLADDIKSAIIDKWYDKESCAFATGSQACQAFALWLGIVPENDIHKAAKRMRDDLVNNDYMITTGNLCTKYLFDELAENGYIDTAWELMLKETYPSIGYMIEQEATTVWERFELMKNANMNSHNHPMYASVDYFFYAHILGAKPTQRGWKEFSVAPRIPDRLMSAQGMIETPYGDISIRWTRRYGKYNLHVNVPYGTTAKISFRGIESSVGYGFHTLQAE